MSRISGILCQIITGNVGGAGTDGRVYLGLGEGSSASIRPLTTTRSIPGASTSSAQRPRSQTFRRRRYA